MSGEQKIKKFAQNRILSPKESRRCDKASGKERKVMNTNYPDTDIAVCNVAEEIQVLSAISQVSARMARNLLLFAVHHSTMEGETIHDK